MKVIRARIKHSCLIAASVTILSFGSNAFGSFLITAPTKILTCELLLRSGLELFGTRENIIPVLRGATFDIQNKVKGSANDGTTFKSVNYIGRADGMNGKIARQVVQRLNGLEENLQNPNLDAQIVAYEVRGNDIRNILSILGRNEPVLRNIYEKQMGEVFSDSNRAESSLFNSLAGIAHFVMASVVVGDYQSMVSNQDLSPLPEIVVGSLFLANGVNVYRQMFNYNMQKYDFKFKPLLKFLSEMTTSPSPEQIFVSSSQIELPSDFHRMLMSEVESAESVQAARNEAIEKWGGGYTQSLFRYVTSGEFFHSLSKIRSAVQNAGDLTRNVYMDHIVYFDKTTNEPVWLFIYRAFRNQPIDRPPRKAEQQQSVPDYQWVPGLSARPVPVK